MTTLLRLFEELAADPAAKARFAAAPDQFLAESGFGALPPEDVAEALDHAADSFPPALAAQVDAESGLQSLAEVDLQQLGLNSVEDFDAIWEPTQAAPSPDSTPDESGAEAEPAPAEDEPGLFEDPLAEQDALALEDPLSLEDPLVQGDALIQGDPALLDFDDPGWSQASDPVDELEPFGQIEDIEDDVGDELL